MQYNILQSWVKTIPFNLFYYLACYSCNKVAFAFCTMQFSWHKQTNYFWIIGLFVPSLQFSCSYLSHWPNWYWIARVDKNSLWHSQKRRFLFLSRDRALYFCPARPCSLTKQLSLGWAFIVKTSRSEQITHTIYCHRFCLFPNLFFNLFVNIFREVGKKCYAYVYQ